MDRIKRLSNEVLNEYSERFGTDFSTNKQTLNEISIIRSKGLKNEIAGYITKMLQRQAKFEERKQTVSIYLKEQDDTYYIICNKDNFKTCTFYATVKNKPYTELISKEQFNKIKESIKK